MRPTEGFGRPRPTADNDSAEHDPYASMGMSSFHAVTGSQTMSYCVADEAAVNASLEQSLASFTRPPTTRDVRKVHAQQHPPANPPATAASSESDSGAAPDSAPSSSSFQHQPAGTIETSSFSLCGHAESSAAASASALAESEEDSPYTKTAIASTAVPIPTLIELLSRSVTPPHNHRHHKPSSTPRSGTHQPAGLSLPMTPILLGVSGPASTFSGISSRRNSLTSESLFSEVDGDFGLGLTSDRDPGVGPAVGPTRETEGIFDMEVSQDGMMDSGSAPQLVMPSIKMPSRRPFSEEGKRLGRVKLLIAGASGSGKTSLIKALVQSCTHIVHVDPIVPYSGAFGSSSEVKPKYRTRPSPSASRAPDSLNSTEHITEIFASTKPLPDWWSGLDDFGGQRRRKSLGDAVLDRNLCFVDTPGFSAGPSQSLENVVTVVQYVESHLERMSSNSLSDTDLLHLIGGEGGPQVDAVLYLVSNDLTPADMHYLKMLAPLTNIIPLLAQADALSPEKIASSKERILAQLLEAGVRPLGFSGCSPFTGPPTATGTTSSGTLIARCRTDGPSPPFAISSAMGSDSEIMDASLLMSPEYVQPLMPSELSALVEQILSSDGTSRLRHAAARKYVQWRSGEGQQNRPQALYRPLSTWPPSQYQHPQRRTPLTEMALAPFAAGDRTVEHNFTGFGEPGQPQGQFRLADWAAELQRSLTNERASYEALARGDRAVWLTERLNECVQDGTLVPVRTATNDNNNGKAGSDTRQQQVTRPPSSASSSRQPGPRVAPASTAGSRNATGAAQRSLGQAGRPNPHSSIHHQQIRQRVPRSSRGGLRRDVVDVPEDPLGLLQVAADLRATGWVTLEVLGSIGVLGGLALWITDRYWPVNVNEWLFERWLNSL